MTVRPRAPGVVCALFLTFALARVVSAAPPQDAEASKLFREGSSAFARGDYRAAALAFEEANRRSPRAATLYNAATAWERANELTRAAEDFDLLVSTGALTGADLDDARARLTDLDARLGIIAVDVPPASTIVVDGAPLPSGLLRAHVRPGKHVVEVTFADGRRASREVAVDRGATVRIELSPPPELQHPRLAPVATNAPPPPTPPAPAEHASDASVERTIGVVALVTALTSVATAAITGGIALNARDQFFESKLTDVDAHDRAAVFRTTANVAWVTAGVTGAAGLLFLWHPWNRPSRAPRAASF